MIFCQRLIKPRCFYYINNDFPVFSRHFSTFGSKTQKNGSNGVYYLIASASIVATSSLLLISNENSLKPYYRIANLCGSVSIICADYGTFMIYNRNQNNEYDKLKKALRQAQHDHEYYLGLSGSAKSINEVRNAKARSVEARLKIDQTALAIAQLSSNDESLDLRKVHQRSAIRLRDLCAANKGIYIKLGQHLAQLDYLLPPEYITVLRTLLSATPESPIESVRRVIFEDFGAYPEDLWSRFEQEPIASASLAQVHVAYDENGQKYAIKVQHEGLVESAAKDMAAIAFILTVVSKLFRDFPYMWLVREIYQNLPKEIDFLNEVENLKKCTETLDYLICSGDVAVPIVHRASRRVICMSFEEGCHISDLKEMKQLGIDPGRVAHLVSTTFCHQM